MKRTTPEAATAETPEESGWESLCARCGQCCFEKWVDEDGTIHPTSIPCRFLDIHSRHCLVYHKRFDVGEGCVRLTPEVVKVVQWLPADCAYVRQVRKISPESKVPDPRSKTRRVKLK